jgi:hypothetical protein
MVCLRTDGCVVVLFSRALGPHRRTLKTSSLSLKTRGSLQVERVSEKGRKNKAARMIAIDRGRERQGAREGERVCECV